MHEDVSPNKNGWFSIDMLVLGGVDNFRKNHLKSGILIHLDRITCRSPISD